MLKVFKLLVVSAFLINVSGFASEIKAGMSRKVITPQGPAFLSGYANREKPSTGVIHDLWAKALVLEESSDSRIVIVTTDLLGLSHEISENVARRINKKYGIKRSQLLFNSSHTHSGPMVWPCLDIIADYSFEEQQSVSRYSQKLTEDIVALIDDAMSHMEPVQISTGHSSADFAINRRLPTAKGISSGVNPNGPVDHDVPVVKISSPDGKIKAVLFSYACHNTTIVGNNFLINGDYAGFAQIELEKAYPGINAMFILGCAGDQNPSPRGTVALAEKYGKSLAAAVKEALEGKQQVVKAPIRTSYNVVDLHFQPFNLETYQKDVVGTNKFLQRRAMLMLEAYNKGWDVSKYPYPVQAINFGNSFTILALSGEVVIDYAKRAKQIYHNQNLLVAGYCNEVMCYIPSKRILKEGGYEAVDNMIYYGMPGPFTESVEEDIFKAINKVMKDVGVKPARN